MQLQMKDVDVVAYTGDSGHPGPAEFGVPPGRVQDFQVNPGLPANSKIIGTWYSLADNISNQYILHHCEAVANGANQVTLRLGSTAGLPPGRTRVRVHVLYERN